MIGSTRGYIKSNRDKVVRFLKGFVEGIAYVKQNRNESIEVVKKKLRVGPAQMRNLERAIDLLINKYYENLPYPSLRGVETVLGFIEKDHAKAKGADPKAFIDDSLLREIEQSGLVKTLYQK
jgi:ABC-type nitrate/sulfonate/bicarbonate transport system substrate-binding protein